MYRDRKWGGGKCGRPQEEIITCLGNSTDVFPLSTVSKQFSTLKKKKNQNPILPKGCKCILKPEKVKEGEGSRQILCSDDK